MRIALAVTALVLAGCITVDVGGEGSVITQYVLSDAGAPPPRRAAPVAEALLIQTEAGDPIADSLSIAYARRNGERALYQLATWSDRPSRRIPQLVQRRLEARGSFAAVAMLGQPLAADWQLALAIDDIHHDLTSEPGRARLAVRAALYDRHNRGLAAQRTFTVEVAVTEAKSATAAVAMGQSVAGVLDALVPWIEQEVERARRKGG